MRHAASLQNHILYKSSVAVVQPSPSFDGRLIVVIADIVAREFDILAGSI